MCKGGADYVKAWCTRLVVDGKRLLSAGRERPGTLSADMHLLKVDP